MREEQAAVALPILCNVVKTVGARAHNVPVMLTVTIAITTGALIESESLVVMK
jgi:hypothetical protein